jgi:hypothetical protein
LAFFFNGHTVYFELKIIFLIIAVIFLQFWRTLGKKTASFDFPMQSVDSVISAIVIASI